MGVIEDSNVWDEAGAATATNVQVRNGRDVPQSSVILQLSSRFQQQGHSIDSVL